MNKERLVVYTALFTSDIEYVYGTLPEYDINDVYRIYMFY
jgi:hypothetical protein